MACWFCDDNASEVVCAATICQQRYKDWEMDELQAYYAHVRTGMRAAWQQRGKDEDNYALTWLERWWYLFKLWICVAFELTDSGPEAYPEAIEMACYHHAKLYAGWEADWIRVGHGIFTGWWFDLHHDGEWEL